MRSAFFYCYNCQTRLRSEQFETGEAFRILGRTACARCADALLLTLAPEDRHAELNRDTPTSGAPGTARRGVPMRPPRRWRARLVRASR
jgi:hypothetical protein